jgi:ketosteroid isomerase-like protein
VQPHDEPLRNNLASTRAVAETFMSYWAVQDVTETVSMLANDAVSVVYLDEKRVSMSGEIIGRDAIAEGLYGNLAMWHYRAFDWVIASVDANTARVQITFDYLHQKTGLPYASSMRMVLTVRDEAITRVECYHDGPRAAAFFKLLTECEAAMTRGE